MKFPGDDQLDTFPTIPDFAIALEDSAEGGKHIAFTSGIDLRLAGFPAWDHADRDLRHFTPADVPIGTMDEPYDDAGEGWRMAIFERRGFVYVLEGNEPLARDFPVFFRVAGERYVQAWAAIIDAHNPILPLADADGGDSDAGVDDADEEL